MCPAQRNNSDSEDDVDYVPPTHEQPDSDSSENESHPRGKVAESTTTKPEESENNQKYTKSTSIMHKELMSTRREAIWASFQASLAPSEDKARESTGKKLVKVHKRYLFAGEYTTEIVEVPEDSVDAKKWPLYQEGGDKPSFEGVTPKSETLVSPVTTSPAEIQQKKPGPRKPKKVLGALPSSSSQKAKKLTTLDKSMMDWKAHTVNTDLADELDTNRKGGGYLERVEFLRRVEERKEENLEATKSRKRRKL